MSANAAIASNRDASSRVAFGPPVHATRDAMTMSCVCVLVEDHVPCRTGSIRRWYRPKRSRTRLLFIRDSRFGAVHFLHATPTDGIREVEGTGSCGDVPTRVVVQKIERDETSPASLQHACNFHHVALHISCQHVRKHRDDNHEIEARIIIGEPVLRSGRRPLRVIGLVANIRQLEAKVWEP